jgi:aryl-alcohol dehydrogenase-like predicted oxidoreductase
MGYGYDPGNRKMADGKLLRSEVERCLGLLQCDTIDILNFPFLQSALDEDADYLNKIRDNVVASLKDAGLIRFASADNFSGESTYLTQIGSGIFNSISINCNFADASATGKVFPAAQAAGMGIITREVFQKGRLFTMGEEAAVADRSFLARTALKWNLSVPQVTTALVGAENPDQLNNDLRILRDLSLGADDLATLDSLLATSTGQKFHQSKKTSFLG